MMSQPGSQDGHKDQAIRVVLVDRHVMVREGLCRILAAEAGIAVVGSVGDGPEALTLAARLRPDVVILDADLPDVARLISCLAADAPTASVVILSAAHQDVQAVALVRAGARGYLSKYATGQELITAVRVVGQGELALEAAVLKAVIGQLVYHQDSVGAVADTPYEILSARELEVLRLLCQGRTDKEIAQRLYLSVRTVNSHVSHIYAKLGVGTRTEAMHVALQQGLITVATTASTPAHQ